MIRPYAFFILGAFVCGLTLPAASAYEVGTHEDLIDGVWRIDSI
jgi:hypothetical protein